MRAPQWHLPFFDAQHQALAQGLHAWCPSQEVDERDDRQACREWVQRLAQGDGFLGDLPPRPLETLRQTLLKIPPFRHGSGQYHQLMKLAMRLHVDLGPAVAQQILAETCCREIRDLPCYFQSTPKQISPG